MAAWNDTFTQATDWTAVSFLEMFWSAARERLLLLSASRRGYTATRGVKPTFDGHAGEMSYIGAVATAVAAGIYPAKVHQEFVADPGSSPATYHHLFSILVMQRMCVPGSISVSGWEDNGVAWANETITDRPVPWTWSALAAAAGVNGDGFTRKFPKEFSAAAATEYGMGLTVDGAGIAGVVVALGDKARYTGTTGTLRKGEVYKRVNVSGTPTWVIVDATSEAAVPDTLTSHGFISAGDYIGPWIWNEIRDVFNHLRWTVQTKAVTTTWGWSPTLWVESPRSGDYWSGLQRADNEGTSTYAALRPLIEANYPGMTETDGPWSELDYLIGAGMLGVGAIAQANRIYDEFGAEVVSQGWFVRASITLRGLVSTHIASSATMYVKTVAPIWDTSIGVSEYATHGDALVPAAAGWGIVGTWAKAAASDEKVSITLGSTAMGTIDWPAITASIPSATFRAGYRGYGIADFCLLVKWDVSGGLAFTSST